jgi:hypothetical protein
MIALAILFTMAAVVWTLMVLYANGMRSSPGAFQGNGSIVVAWAVAALMWLAWWLN